MVVKSSKSKKPSDAKLSLRQPKPIVLFLDRSLGRRKVAHVLRQAGAEVEVQDDHFPTDERDEIWLREVGHRGWIVLTKDDRIRYRTPALLAIRRTRVMVFVAAGNLRGDETGKVFVKALPRISQIVNNHSPPLIARVSKGGNISILFPKKEK
jgi:predicted nuclease of predicted toxin-antitoxin system